MSKLEVLAFTPAAPPRSNGRNLGKEWAEIERQEFHNKDGALLSITLGSQLQSSECMGFFLKNNPGMLYFYRDTGQDGKLTGDSGEFDTGALGEFICVFKAAPWNWPLEVVVFNACIPGTTSQKLRQSGIHCFGWGQPILPEAACTVGKDFFVALNGVLSRGPSPFDASNIFDCVKLAIASAKLQNLLTPDAHYSSLSDGDSDAA